MYKGQVVSHQKMKIIRYCYLDTKPSSHICIAHLKRSFNSTQSLQNNEIWSNLFCQKLGLDWTSVERPPLTEISRAYIKKLTLSILCKDILMLMVTVTQVVPMPSLPHFASLEWTLAWCLSLLSLRSKACIEYILLI